MLIEKTVSEGHGAKHHIALVLRAVQQFIKRLIRSDFADVCLPSSHACCRWARDCGLARPPCSWVRRPLLVVQFCVALNGWLAVRSVAHATRTTSHQGPCCRSR